MDISVIVRSRNSSKHIWKCLKAIRKQKLPESMTFETIVLDNESTDDTVSKAKKLADKVFAFSELRPSHGYSPGSALNAAFGETSGKAVAVISAHCMPETDQWLASYARSLEALFKMYGSRPIAGMYGRQIPAKSLSAAHRVQIYTVFDTEPAIQMSGCFFHHGNALILKNYWDACPFDETLPTLEDRRWAQDIQQKSGELMYVPEATVVRFSPLFHPEHAPEALAVIERGG